MLHRWIGALLCAAALGGLCPAASANTTGGDASPGITADPGAAAEGPALLGPVTGAVSLPTTETEPLKRLVRMALLLPLQSDALRQPAEAVRAGFLAAFERDQSGLAIDVIETGDAPQEILAAYNNARNANDIIIGPLSRSGVTALAQSGAVTKPTVALTQPDAEIQPPPKMLLIGLSIEEEAKQVASWAGRDAARRKAIVLSTNAAWQKRAARAFVTQWQRLGRDAEQIELAAPGGYLNGRVLLDLKKTIQADKSVLLFAALDANQARQARALLGSEIPLFGTSQLNALALNDGSHADRVGDMNGVRLLDIPWQLQADHPAAMVYPRLVVSADQRRSADLERLYALGIDAFRVGRELASDRTSFQLDGVTGRLAVRFGQEGATFERTALHAVYRDGIVVAETR